MKTIIRFCKETHINFAVLVVLAFLVLLDTFLVVGIVRLIGRF